MAVRENLTHLLPIRRETPAPSELAALDLADITVDQSGLLIAIRRAKTDQEGMAVSSALPPDCTPRPIRSAPLAPGSTATTMPRSTRRASSSPVIFSASTNQRARTTELRRGGDLLPVRGLD